MLAFSSLSTPIFTIEIIALDLSLKTIFPTIGIGILVFR